MRAAAGFLGGERDLGLVEDILRDRHAPIITAKENQSLQSVIALLRKAREEGVRVTADQYPYPASSTSLAAMAIPAKWREGSDKDLLKRLDDPELSAKIRKDIQEIIDDRDYGNTLQIARFVLQSSPRQ